VHLLDLALWLLQPSAVSLVDAELSGGPPVETSARVRLLLDEVPFDLEVSWNASLPQTEIAFELDDLHWENVDGSFFHFRTRLGERVLLDRETTLRADTLRAFVTALETQAAPPVDVRVYSVLEQALRQH
jgi:predicted dehydrogenase